MSKHHRLCGPRRVSSRPARAAAVRIAWTLALAGGLAVAAESRIELRDGSVITGELVGIGDGSYRVRSGALGEVKVPESQVLVIRPVGAPTPLAAPMAATPPVGGADGTAQGIDLGTIRQQLLAQPDTMEAIGRLQGDPEIQALLSDPDLIRRIMSGDLEGVRSDPRFQRLLENPEIQAIISRVLGR